MRGMNIINCDQVVWLLDIADRYIPDDKYPSISQQRDMQMYAMLYEIMEVTGLTFADSNARRNGTPPRVRSSN